MEKHYISIVEKHFIYHSYFIEKKHYCFVLIQVVRPAIVRTDYIFNYRSV